MKIRLRNYKPKDFDKLLQVLKRAGVYYELLDTPKLLKKKIKKDPESIIVAEDDKKSVLGCVFTINDGWNPQIFHLAVDPKYQNKGLGKTLLKEAEKRLKGDGAKEITVFVEERNSKVLDFYRKRGYAVLYKTYCLIKHPK